MRFEWDEEKNGRNLAKHKLSFETAQLVFEDEYQFNDQDRVVDGECRWQTLGEVDGIVLQVAHTWRDDEHGEVIRLISARKAIKRERRAYEENRRRASQ